MHLRNLIYISAITTACVLPTHQAYADWETDRSWGEDSSWNTEDVTKKKLIEDAVRKVIKEESTLKADDNKTVNGFEMRLGFSTPIGMADTQWVNPKTNQTAEYLNIGFTMGLELGYRWSHFGLYLQQYLGGSVYKGDNFDKLYLTDDYVADISLENGTTSFFGSTYIAGKGFIGNQTSSFVISFGVGLIYGSKEILPIDSLEILEDKVYYGLALKAGIGYEYRMTSNSSFGIHIDYAPYMLSGFFKGKFISKFIHTVQPSVHFGYTF